MKKNTQTQTQTKARKLFLTKAELAVITGGSGIIVTKP